MWLTRIHLVFLSLCYRAIKLGATLRCAGLVAWAWRRLTSVHLHREENPHAPHRLLVLDKTGLTGDLAEAFHRSPDGDFCLFSLPRRALKEVAGCFLPVTFRSDVAYLSNDPQVVDAKARYRAFLAEVWTRFSPRLRLQGVLTGNYSFYAEREFAAALEEMGVPFFALHKECVGPPIIWEGYERNCREEKGPFTGHAVTVYNERWREMMIRAGVAGEEKITTVGCPRMDVYHRYRRSSPPLPNKQVTFFSFLPTAGLPFIGGGEKAILWPEHAKVNGGTWAWEALAEQAHRAVIDLAREEVDLRVVIKVKVGKAYRDYITKLADGNLPENLRIVSGGEADQLICESSVIAGFNSTTLLEGIAAGKPVVVPRFGEASNPGTWVGILELDGAVTWAEDVDSFKRLLATHAEASTPPPEILSPSAVRVLEEYVGNADGKAGERMRNGVLEYLKGAE